MYFSIASSMERRSCGESLSDSDVVSFGSGMVRSLAVSRTLTSLPLILSCVSSEVASHKHHPRNVCRVKPVEHASDEADYGLAHQHVWAGDVSLFEGV